MNILLNEKHELRSGWKFAIYVVLFLIIWVASGVAVSILYARSNLEDTQLTLLTLNESALFVAAVGAILLTLRFVDRTTRRLSTFFGNGVVAHVAFAEPICGEVTKVIADACKKSRVTGKLGGTYLCMEGPQFSTRAESNLYRSWGMDVIGMTNLQEAKLAREAEICYTTIALVTDYDCWHPQHDAVTVTDVLENLKKNTENAQKLIRGAVKRLPIERSCKCGRALKHAIMTDLSKVPDETCRKLELLLRKYL